MVARNSVKKIPKKLDNITLDEPNPLNVYSTSLGTSYTVESAKRIFYQIPIQSLSAFGESLITFVFAATQKSSPKLDYVLIAFYAL